MGGPRWCITGGFIEAKETPEIAQAREAEEESGLNTLSAVKSPFFSFIQDRLFFVGNPTKGEGVKVYFFEVPYSEVSKTIDVESIYKIKDGMMSSKMQKRSEALHFFEWTEAVGKTGDGIALAAIAQFIAYLNKKTEDTL